MYERIHECELAEEKRQEERKECLYGRVPIAALFLFMALLVYGLIRVTFFPARLPANYPTQDVTLSHVDCPFLVPMLNEAIDLQASIASHSVPPSLAKTKEWRLNKTIADIAALKAAIRTCHDFVASASLLNPSRYSKIPLNDYFFLLGRMKNLCDTGKRPGELLAKFFGFSENSGFPPRGFCDAVRRELDKLHKDDRSFPLPSTP